MKLKEMSEIEKESKVSNPESPVDVPDSQWENQPGLGEDAKSLRKKIASLDHQADIMCAKLDKWTKVAKGKVFTSFGLKSGMPLPPQVKQDPRAFASWTLTHANQSTVTKVFAKKDDPKIVLPIRALVDRHNTLTNARAEAEGQLAKLKTAEVVAKSASQSNKVG